MVIIYIINKAWAIKMRQSKNILTDKELELVSLLMQGCHSTGDICCDKIIL